MQIEKIVDGDKVKYMDLLLIADEQVSMIEKYLYRGVMFALFDDDLKTLCIVTQEQPDVYEIKNKNAGRELYVGIGDSPVTEFLREMRISKIAYCKKLFCRQL